MAVDPSPRAGVATYIRDGRRYQHPVAASQRGLGLLCVRKTAAAERNANAVLGQAVRSRGALFFAYPFDFPLTNGPVMRAPWFSAMAQGQALSLFVRLYRETSERHWLRAADETFASFLVRPVRGRPWVSFVDRSGYLWLEEYPGDDPGRVFNGHIFASWGLADYYLLSRDPRAKRLLEGALATVKHYFGEWRNRGGETSLYGLGLRNEDLSYHVLHARQLDYLAHLTGDIWFRRAAEAMAQADAPDP